MKSYKIILASASPRRRELLKSLFPEFEVRPSDAPELDNGRFPSRMTVSNAKAKAMSVADEGGVVIAADTVVYMDGKYYLKPKSIAEAHAMLKALSGRTHYVYTGVAVKCDGKTVTFYEKSAVKIRAVTDLEISRYISGGSPLDKAGAYGIQDNVVVQSYSGSYTNIIGLPLEKLSDVLKKLGVL